MLDCDMFGSVTVSIQGGQAGRSSVNQSAEGDPSSLDYVSASAPPNVIGLHCIVSG